MTHDESMTPLKHLVKVLQLGTPRDTSSQRYVYREYDVTFVVD